MDRMSPRIVVFALIAAYVSSAPAAAAEPDFSRDVRPILSQYCFKCHGPDDSSRAAGVRLDRRETALGQGDSGTTIIVPGRPDASELLTRVDSTDPDVVMPPPSTHLVLSSAQRGVLRAWVQAGAPYAPHWAFVPPRESAPPVDPVTEHPVDAFVQAEARSHGLTASPPADLATLARRVSLDLIGIPPSWDQIQALQADPRPDAYERYVDQLLASPRYGERWARRWLDLARYADTNGYEKDRPRSVWPYRDWVIRAINEDMPFDQFTIEQLAGDLLPNPTESQLIATGFHRQTMLNEEGGIDPLEFRFHALTDRIATTGTVWLGLTTGCAQCHTHKYDPLTHTDYYRLMAFFNNADEPEIELQSASVEAQRALLERQIARREQDLPTHYPPSDPWSWQVPRVLQATSAQGATLAVLEDQSILVSGTSPESDTYTLLVEATQPEIAAIQLEALTDDSLGQKGPGRTPHGNFVVTELHVDRQLTEREASPIAFQSATADFSQDKFPAEQAVDAQPQTGWAIQGPGAWNVPRALTARFSDRVRPDGPSRWTVRIEQWYGAQHTLGKFRIRLGSLVDTRPSRIRRQTHLQEKFAAWTNRLSQRLVPWQLLRPARWTSTLPRLALLDDGSILASGDLSKRDVYEFTFGPELDGATALRLEALPDPSLPRRGPGLVYYEGPAGDFFLSELQVESAGVPATFAGASETFASGKHNAAAAIDGNPLTGWSVNEGQGQPHVAVVRFAAPLPATGEHVVRLIFERYYAAALGRFRLSATKAASVDPQAAQSTALTEILSLSAEARTPEQKEFLLREFCKQAPELATEVQAIRQMQQHVPERPTTLVFRERPPEAPRTMHRHHRGEYLQPREEVSSAIPEFLRSDGAPQVASRLDFARWLVDGRNPLTARVTVNRHWSAFFGRGLVRTVDDFGYQGELPTHPQLLDWLANEFVRSGWSVKQLHRLIVTSGTYRQSSVTTPEQLAMDPQNLWLARGPRGRLDAETVRDSVLAVAGLLSDKIGGPSVFPPQPASITTEGAYGKLTWTVSPGEDRYRRGLYTFAKRTTPFAMLATFDAPSGEACLARRESSNTPLQALTLLNDVVLVEAAQTIGRASSTHPGTLETLCQSLFEQVLGRGPAPEELQTLVAFARDQQIRLQSGQLNARQIAGEASSDVEAAALGTIVARVLLNLDETINRQ